MDTVLLTRYGGWGDLIAILPTIVELRKRHPKAKFVLRTYVDYKDFFRGSKWIDEIVLDDNRYQTFPAQSGTFKNQATGDDIIHHYNFSNTADHYEDAHMVNIYAHSARITLPNPLEYGYTPGIFDCYDFLCDSPSVVVQCRKVGDGRDLIAEDLPLSLAGAYFIDAKLPERNYINLIANCRVFIGPDSSGLHIAAACGVPHVFGLYTPKFHPAIRAYRGFHTYLDVKEMGKDITAFLSRDKTV